MAMVAWRRLSEERPDLAHAGKALLYQHGVGLAFLATIRTDSGPRLHPMCPLLTADGLFAFIIASPKQDDLRRDGRYAMHSFPCPDNEDAFYVTGTARLISEQDLRHALSRQFVEERARFVVAPPGDDDALVEFDIERCLWTKTTGHGDPRPQHQVWRAAEARPPT